MDIAQAETNVQNTKIEKEIIMNRIIAAGLNSLASATYSNSTNSPERQLLDTFVLESFDKIFPCWGMLDDKIRFFVFKTYMKDFEDFMKSKIGEQNV